MYNAYPMNNNFNNQMYMQDLQNMRDRIDQQMRQIQQPMPNQQMPSINQTFQLASTQTNNSELEGKFVKDIDEVRNTLVLKTGVFLNNDYSILWVKDASGNIRSFNTMEIIELDEKDKQIAQLKQEKEESNKTIMLLKTEIENIKNNLQLVNSDNETKNKSKGADK